tara:strand:- start:3549 stop:4295 length:747 start_codon:yes stop_codon:yes gene_type:complete
MKTIYILITALFLSTASSFAQIEGIFGDIMEEVQEKVGDAQQEAADTASMKEFKNEIKEILAGINGLDKYSRELKCIYLILKLALLEQSLETRIENTALCQEKYDLYGMQLMVKASYTGIGYCFDSLTELFDESNYTDLGQLMLEYLDLSDRAISCYKSGLKPSEPEKCSSFKGISKLEIDFVKTVGLTLGPFDAAFNNLLINGELDDDLKAYYFMALLKYLIQEYNPVAALAKSINIGSVMSSLPCK